MILPSRTATKGLNAWIASRSSFVRSKPWTRLQSASHSSRSPSASARTSTSSGGPLEGLPLATATGSLTSKPSDSYSDSDRMWNPS